MLEGPKWNTAQDKVLILLAFSAVRAKAAGGSCGRRASRSQVNKGPKVGLLGNQKMQASVEKIWASAQEKLRSMLSADTFNLWFAPLRVSAADNHGIIL